MSANFSGGLIGLSLLARDPALAAFASPPPVESRAVRAAKAQFTTRKVAAPWQQPRPSLPAIAQLAAIRNMKSVVDPASERDASLPADVRTAFIAYKALERLKLVAEHAARPAAADAERASLQKLFAAGLSDLRGFLATAPADKVKLAFGIPTRRTESVAIAAPAFGSKTLGTGLLDERTAPLAGLRGDEVLRIGLSKNGSSDEVTVDLATISQPPTLDGVADAINAAIAAVPMRDTQGEIVRDADGNAMPKYIARFAVDKGSGKWGLALDAPAFEKVALDEFGAKDALIVAAGRAAPGAAAAAQILRFDDPEAEFAQRSLGSISAVDRLASERAALAKAGADQVPGATTAQAIATDSQGFSYVVGTAAGDLGSNRSAGGEDLFLTKLDSRGEVVWQRMLGAAAGAQGAAVVVTANGDVVVAGTVRGPFEGALGDDSDMLVMRFDADGEEKFATAVRALGDDVASAVAVGADGSIYVGGRAAGGGGDAFLARIGPGGQLAERRLIDSGGSDAVTALAIDGNGDLLALTRESGTAMLRRIGAVSLAADLGEVALGAMDAHALAVSGDGRIAVGGAVRSEAGDRDGSVALIGADLSAPTMSRIATGADDEVDSLAFLGGTLFAGGRTAGALGGALRGSVDGFIARIDPASGAVGPIGQFGQVGHGTGPVRIAAAVGGAAITERLGFARGTLNPDPSAGLVSQTTLRPGDEFALRVDGGPLRRIAVAAYDTLASFAEKIRRAAGRNVTVSTPRNGDTASLRIEAKPGHAVELAAGAAGKDALAKLGIDPARLAAAPLPDKNAPRVRPGGTFGLGLKQALHLGTAKDAARALNEIRSALSVTQTAFRSLYWDAGKAALVDGPRSGGGGSPYQQAQLAKYRDALTRMSALNAAFQSS